MTDDDLRNFAHLVIKQVEGIEADRLKIDGAGALDREYREIQERKKLATTPEQKKILARLEEIIEFLSQPTYYSSQNKICDGSHSKVGQAVIPSHRICRTAG